MNFLQIFYCLVTATIIIVSSLINLLEPLLPKLFIQIFRYGKFAAKTKSNLAIEVPKSWFKHFYLLAFFVFTYLVWLVTMVYYFDMPVPDYVKQFLDLLCGNQRVAHCDKNKVYLAVVLMTLQVYRRLYDTQKISIFGSHSRINISHYILGLLHYPGVAVAIICEAPMFANDDNFHNEKNNFWSISLSDKIAALIFILAWKHQYICTKILANLRKNEKGDVVTNGHKIPHGDWFEYLSCPHQTAEILMYSCIMWILWHNFTWFFVYAWVLSNQIETILLSHWWYQEKFDYFPKSRKACIPFVY